MCFLITKETPYPLLATEDIVCFKVVFTDLKSFHQDFQYEVGETYKMEEDLKIEKVEINLENSLVIHEGFHSYLSYEFIDVSLFISPYGRTKRLECVIPKGSTYYVNEYFGEYVSNNLKILQIIK